MVVARYGSVGFSAATCSGLANGTYCGAKHVKSFGNCAIFNEISLMTKTASIRGRTVGTTLVGNIVLPRKWRMENGE